MKIDKWGKIIALFLALTVVMSIMPWHVPSALAGNEDQPLVQRFTSGTLCLQTGREIASNGVGLVSASPIAGGSGSANLTLNIPATATPVKAYLYWEGLDIQGGGDNQVTLDGNTITGDQLGDNAFVDTGIFAYAYQADVTSYIVSGNHTYTIGGLDSWTMLYQGASLVVVYEDASAGHNDIQIWAGDDLVNEGAFNSDDNPITLQFEPAAVDRTVHVTFILGGLESNESAKVMYGTGTSAPSASTQLATFVGSGEGNYWNNYSTTFTLPAGHTYATLTLKPNTSNSNFEWVAAHTSVQSPCPEVEVSKSLVTPADGIAVVGEAVQFQIVVTNTGITTLNTVPLQDTYDKNKISFQGATPAPSDNTDDGQLDWSNLGSLDPGQSVTVTVNFTAAGATWPYSTTNTALVSGAVDQNDRTPPDASDDATVKVTHPSLTLSKELVSPSNGIANVGESVVFRITITNSDDTTLTTVPLRDTYDSTKLSFQSATTSPDSTASGQLDWNNVGPLSGGESKVITVTFTAIASTLPYSTTNTAQTHDVVDQNGDSVENKTDSANVTITNPGYEMSKELTSPSIANVGEQVTFRITIHNTGDTTLDTVKVRDTYDNTKLSFQSATVSPDDSNDDGQLDWSNVGPLSPGATKTIDLTFTAIASADPTTNTALVHDVTDENLDALPDKDDDASVKITHPALTIAKELVSPSGGIANVGDAVQFRITITNTGDTAWQTVPLNDTYDTTYLTYQNSSPASVDNNDDGSIDWSNVGPIPVGGSKTVLVNFVAKASTGQNSTTNTALVSNPRDENNDTVPDQSDSADVRVTNPGLQLSKVLVSPSNGIATVGENVVFHIVITNTGDTEITTLPIRDTYDTTYLTYQNASPASDDNNDDGQIDWSNVGSLASGASKTITVTFLAKASTLPGNTVNSATSHDVVDENGAPVPDGSDTEPVTITNPGVEVVKTLITPASGQTLVGDPVTFQIVVRNTGDTILTHLPLTDTYETSCLAYATTSASPNENSTGAGAIYWSDLTASFGQDLAPGESFTVTVPFNTVGSCHPTINTATVNGEDEHGDTVSDSDTADVDITAPASIGDYVWNDSNGNGQQDESASLGINGVKVNLWNDANGSGAIDTGDSILATATTQNDGSGNPGWYEFTHLWPGNYIVQIDDSNFDSGKPLHGMELISGSQSGPEPYPKSLSEGENYMGADFGYAGRGDISGVVFYDWDQSHSQGLGEDGIPNVQVCLYQDSNNNGHLDTGEPQLECKQTGSDGSYVFTNYLPGNYIVTETNPAGYTSTTPDELAVQLIVVGASGSAPNNNYGDVDYAKLGDMTYIDTNGNGQQDSGETLGVSAPITVTGHTVNGQDVIYTLSSDANGVYHVQDLIPGTYTVTVGSVDGYILTSQNPLITTLEPGESDLDMDFGFLSPTGVQVASLSAQAPASNEVVLRWQTVSEEGIDGFRIMRALKAKGPWNQIGEVQSNAVGGSGDYTFVDKSVKGGKTYWYRLVSLPDGEDLGVTSVTVPKHVDPGVGGNNKIFLPAIMK